MKWKQVLFNGIFCWKSLIVIQFNMDFECFSFSLNTGGNNGSTQNYKILLYKVRRPISIILCILPNYRLYQKSYLYFQVDAKTWKHTKVEWYFLTKMD